MLTEAKKKELKEKFGDELFATTLDSGRTFVWKPLSRSEHRQIINETAEIPNDFDMISERTKRFCIACVVYPEDKKDVEAAVDKYAGLAETLSNEIYRKSGFDLKTETTEL